MAAYYNEIEPFAAQWLRNLIAAGHIAPGDVDERSVEDVKPSDLGGYTQCHFFAGIGIWSLAMRRAGWPDDRPVWTGSCPCQPFSSAGPGAGFSDERHLWPAFHHLIEQCRPAEILGEQVASKDADPWIDLVQSDLEALEYGFGAVPFPASSVGATHIRDRLYWVANSSSQGLQRHWKPMEEHATTRWSSEKRHAAKGNMATPVWRAWQAKQGTDKRFRAIPSITSAPAYVNSQRVGMLRAYGNAIVADQAKLFIETVMEYPK